MPPRSYVFIDVALNTVLNYFFLQVLPKKKQPKREHYHSGYNEQL